MMNKEFKTLLLKIASLPLADQRWVLNQLTTKQKNQFARWKGDSLLNQARQFRKVPYPQLNVPPQTMQLPDFCKELEKLPPLFIAIILEQGKFNWEQQFLLNIESSDEVRHLMEEKIQLLKPATRTCTFEHWQNQLSFSDQLEHLNG